MSNHPNRNWRSRWAVGPAVCEHKPSGLIVSFEREGNNWVGAPSTEGHKRLLKEAGIIFAEFITVEEV